MTGRGLRSARCGSRMATIRIGIRRCCAATRCSRDASSAISTSARCAMRPASRSRPTTSKASACSSRWDARDAICVAGYEDMPKIGAVPETRVGQAQSVVDRAMDHRSARLPSAHPHAEFLFLARPGNATGRVPVRQLGEEFEGLDDCASGAADARSGHQESGVRRRGQGAVRIGRLQRMPCGRARSIWNSGRRCRGLQADRGAHDQGLRAQSEQDSGEDFGVVDLHMAEKSARLLTAYCDAVVAADRS